MDAKASEMSAQYQKVSFNPRARDGRELLSDARKRGNAEEIKHYNEALNLQKEINREERKKLNREEQEKREREAEKQAKSSSSSQSSPRQTSNSNTGSNTSAVEIVDALDARIKRERDEAAKLAVEQIMKQLKDEAKRRS